MSPVLRTPWPARAATRNGRAVAIARAVAEAALAALIALILARAIWFVAYGAEIDRFDLDPSLIPQTASAREETADLTVLTEGRLFAGSAGPAAAAVEDAPETQLDLTLHGVRRGGDAQSGAAIIEAPGEGQRTLPVNAEIAPGVTLEAIYPDRVIINRRGVRESLYLREERARRTSLLRASEAPEAVTSTATPPPEPLTREDWTRGLRLRPAEDGSGYRVLADSEPRLLERAGLEAGDLITAINGRPLSGPADALDALARLGQGGRARFTLLRDGDARTIEVDL
ncbi:hypothetical protein GCM10011367_17010 [Marinicauda pacifica]|uniref:PDZ domain-containing protein n=1 Tax=Marinicauda pacifica TaxID=1133559 RepID=A0A4S2HAZ8_9PROT|nr:MULTISPECIES: type II secretion system protein N [Marinicauda]TGY93107.1 PDZ domain-containing protein [Marinicauda pacifica]GGE42901.1 hypothetical protein GCM10011367_17010 [Marinicauda pacifica]